MSLSSPNSSLKATIQTLLAEASVSVSDSTQDSFGFQSLLQSSLFTEETKHAKSPYAGYGVKSAQGLSKHMEDSYSVQEKLSSPGPDNAPRQSNDASPGSGEISIPGFDEDLAFFSVFDGHGGDEVAQHCSDRLHDHFTKQLLDAATGPADGQSSCITPSLITKALRSSFHTTDQELAGTEAGEFVGATAVVAVVGSKHIWVAHCGDSRAVIQRGGDATALTSDHKPDREDEAARIRSAGGRIVFISGTNRVMGMLAMSRSIGDHYLRPFVIADPEVVCIDRLPEDEVLILATDGLWDVFSCTEATNLASRCINRSKERGMSKHGACRVAASVLAKAAMERGSRDNITIIIVDISLSQDAADALDKEVPSSALQLSDARAPKASGGGSMGKYLLLKSQKQDRQSSQPGGSATDTPRQTFSHDDLLTLCKQQDNEADAGPASPGAISTPKQVKCSPASSECSPSRFKRSPARVKSSPLLRSSMDQGEGCSGESSSGEEPERQGGGSSCSGSSAEEQCSNPKGAQWGGPASGSARSGAVHDAAAQQGPHSLAACDGSPCRAALICRVSFDLPREGSGKGPPAAAAEPAPDHSSSSMTTQEPVPEDASSSSGASGQPSAKVARLVTGSFSEPLSCSAALTGCLSSGELTAVHDDSANHLPTMLSDVGCLHGPQAHLHAHHEPEADLVLSCQ